ncbi:MAG: DNA topoisomerase III, partial [Turicibacter sp.]|nr:DNA topoisomerase III [Turicibacter sp.]
MGDKLVIAEKPSVAEYIAKVIGAKERVKNEKGAYWKGNGYIVTNCIGHLITLAEPDAYDEGLKQWKFETLPFLPEKYKFRIIPQTRKQYDLVKNLMLNPEVDEIIVATDAGREGCAIYGYVAAMVHNTKPEKRLWISSMTEKSVKEGMENLKDNQYYKNMYKAALMRAEADFLVGINMSRYYTLRYGGFEHKFPCGRVQTATLSLIVEREKKIKNFIPQKFFKVYINTANSVQAKYDIEDGCLTKLEDAIQIKNKIHMKKGKVTDYKVEVKNKQRPHLYNLNDLQREGNRKYGYSAKKVLDILQSLYEEHKIATYPRTDSRYLNSDMVPDIIPLLQILCSQKKYLDVAQDLLSNKILIDNHIIDDNKVTDHHAIIPTGQPLPPGLSQDERNVFDTIALRFICVFYPDCSFEQTTVNAEAGKYKFKATGRVIKDPGWKRVYQMRKAATGREEEKDDESRNDDAAGILPEFTKGE